MTKAAKPKEYRNPRALVLDATTNRWKLRRDDKKLRLVASARGKVVAIAHVSHTLAPQFRRVPAV